MRASTARHGGHEHRAAAGIFCPAVKENLSGKVSLSGCGRHRNHFQRVNRNRVPGDTGPVSDPLCHRKFGRWCPANGASGMSETADRKRGGVKRQLFLRLVIFPGLEHPNLGFKETRCVFGLVRECAQFSVRKFRLGFIVLRRTDHQRQAVDQKLMLLKCVDEQIHRSCDELVRGVIMGNYFVQNFRRRLCTVSEICMKLYSYIDQGARVFVINHRHLAQPANRVGSRPDTIGKGPVVNLPRLPLGKHHLKFDGLQLFFSVGHLCFQRLTRFRYVTFSQKCEVSTIDGTSITF